MGPQVGAESSRTPVSPDGSVGSRLTPLFAPRSVAVIGASARPGRPGRQVIEALRQTDRELRLHLITPRHEEILGLRCDPELTSEHDVDLAVIAGAPARIEDDVERAIAAGARSLLVFGAPYSDRPAWLARIARRTRDAGIPLLGPDTLGFAHLARGVAATWATPHVPAGEVALISQSGTVYWEANTVDPRIGLALSVHTGLEATLTLADAMLYVLELSHARVIALYVETIRDPGRFDAALEQAAEREIPVVVLYAGRTDRARAQMTTHAGRMAGDRAALEGLFRRHGAVMTSTPDEWWTTITLLASRRRIGPGGLAAIMDSGGGLAMFLDYSEELGLPTAELSAQTRETVGRMLSVDEPQGSAIDFWVGEADRHATTADLVSTLAADEQTAAVVAFTTYGEPRSAGFASQIADACLAAAERTPKPVIAATYTSRQLHPELMLELSRAGIPTLDGMYTSVAAFAHAFRYRDGCELRRRLTAAGEDSPELPANVVASWRDRLAGTGRLMEAQALEFLADFGIPVVPVRQVQDERAAVLAAGELGFPVVLKTDEGIGHKAARGGVRLGLRGAQEVATAYRELSEELGPRALVAPMVTGPEVALGVVAGEFGATLMVSAGGGLIELLDDRCHLLGPVAPAEVELAMSRLGVTRRLAADPVARTRLDELYALASRLSHVGAAFLGTVLELDVNPVIIGDSGCVAVDALVGTTTAGGEADGG